MRMHPPLNLTGTLAMVGGAGYLGWVILSGSISLIAVIRILRQPADTWKHRNWSKVGWVLAVLYVAPFLGGLPIPVGAVAALWRSGRRSGETAPTAQLPMAKSSADWPWPWGAK